MKWSRQDLSTSLKSPSCLTQKIIFLDPQILRYVAFQPISYADYVHCTTLFVELTTRKKLLTI